MRRYVLFLSFHPEQGSNATGTQGIRESGSEREDGEESALRKEHMMNGIKKKEDGD